MSGSSYFRGHQVVRVDDKWLYADTLTPAGFDNEVRPCKQCGMTFQGSNEGEPDPCLGNLPGVDNACCGHGVPSQAYIRFTSGVVISGFPIIQYTEKWRKP